MNKNSNSKAKLLLEDGSKFIGKSLGIKGIASGEICFNTGMTGYQEIYTDPSYYGQIIINTASHIGNYGTKIDEQESDNSQVRGIIINEYSKIYSRNSTTFSLSDFLLKNNTLGIYDIDTRKLVKHIRSKGVMNCIISTQNLDDNYLESELKKVPSMKNLELASYVTTKKSYFYGNKSSKKKVAVLDLGCKKSILKNFETRNIYCKVFPAKTKSKEILKWNPDGFFISNGPGDPASMDYAVNTVGDIINENIPTFGICLGHQILARACGLATYKLHHGHRGINHPVKNILTGKSEVTSQNHGFSVKMDDIKKIKDIELTHINLNDNTVEGIRLKNKNAFSVQYHPESSPGPHDSRYLFDDFVKMMN